MCKAPVPTSAYQQAANMAAQKAVLFSLVFALAGAIFGVGGLSALQAVSRGRQPMHMRRRPACAGTERAGSAPGVVEPAVAVFSAGHP